VGLTTLPCKKKIVEKPPRNEAGFCGGGQGLRWAVEPRNEDRIEYEDVKWIHPAQNTVQWLAHVNTVMKLRVP
jgi:hypothetical protein